jgi:hypothetical protein
MTAYASPPARSAWANHGDSLLRELITEGPAAALGPRSSRWHLVRWAEDRIYKWGSGEIVRHVAFWCGQFGRTEFVYADVVPDGQPTCGTCYGRREGWMREQGLLFTPHEAKRPSVCPGSRRDDLYEDVFDGWYRCLVCGETVRGWCFGSRYNPSWGLRTHPPGQSLVDPCEWHGHLSLVLAKDGPTTLVTCRCKTLRRTR